MLSIAPSVGASDVVETTWQSPVTPSTPLPVPSTEPEGASPTVVAALGGIGLGLALASGIGLLVARRYRRHTG
jgi:hypothetical protein